MELYIATGLQVARAANTDGIDTGQAVTAWSACVRHIAANPQTFAPVTGENACQRRQRMSNARKQRAELRRVATFALGATLLTLLINWALGKLISWVIDRLFYDMEKTPAAQWSDMFVDESIGLMTVPTLPVSWPMRLAWWFYDCAVVAHKWVLSYCPSSPIR